MSDDDIPSLAEALAEIRRLRAENERLLGRSSHQVDRDAAAEIRRLRTELQEATQLVLKMTKERMLRDIQDACANGTLEKPQDDEQSFYAHNIPPSAPPHDE